MNFNGQKFNKLNWRFWRSWCVNDVLISWIIIEQSKFVFFIKFRYNWTFLNWSPSTLCSFGWLIASVPVHEHPSQLCILVLLPNTSIMYNCIFLLYLNLSVRIGTFVFEYCIEYWIWDPKNSYRERALFIPGFHWYLANNLVI